jgi:hypothetical protein
VSNLLYRCRGHSRVRFGYVGFLVLVLFLVVVGNGVCVYVEVGCGTGVGGGKSGMLRDV